MTWIVYKESDIVLPLLPLTYMAFIHFVCPSRSPSRALLSQPQHWRTAFIIPSEPLGAGRVQPDSDGHWQRPPLSQHLLLPHHSGQCSTGPLPAQTPSALTYFISKNTQRAEVSHVPGPLRNSYRHISLTPDKLPSLFFPPVTFQTGNFYLKWKSGFESNTPSWLLMRASCRLHWSRSYSMTSTLFIQ